MLILLCWNILKKTVWRKNWTCFCWCLEVFAHLLILLFKNVLKISTFFGIIHPQHIVNYHRHLVLIGIFQKYQSHHKNHRNVEVRSSLKRISSPNHFFAYVRLLTQIWFKSTLVWKGRINNWGILVQYQILLWSLE